MWHTYDNGHFWGMHYIWWIIWFLLLFGFSQRLTIFPGQRTKKDTALDILHKRLARGEINEEEYKEMRKIIQQP